LKIINISGFARHGKDTTAELIKESLESKGKRVLITHYAGLLKFMCSEFLGWDGKKDETGRTLLQYVGTDVVRAKDPDYWVNFIADMLEFLGNVGKWDYVLIPDCRFPNENERLKERGFDVKLMRVVRDNFNNGLSDGQQTHESETALNLIKPDYTIFNSGSISDLREKINTWIAEELNEKK
jgi:hypothetical protein